MSSASPAAKSSASKFAHRRSRMPTDRRRWASSVQSVLEARRHPKTADELQRVTVKLRHDIIPDDLDGEPVGGDSPFTVRFDRQESLAHILTNGAGPGRLIRN